MVGMPGFLAKILTRFLTRFFAGFLIHGRHARIFGQIFGQVFDQGFLDPKIQCTGLLGRRNTVLQVYRDEKF